jgi:hypothetical protein
MKNTVMGAPERQFTRMWMALLWNALAKTGRGYRLYTLRNVPPPGASGWRGERRSDKVGDRATKLGRRLMKPAIQA